MINLYDMTRPDLITLLNKHNHTIFHAAAIWKALYCQMVTTMDQITIRPDILALLKEIAILPQPTLRSVVNSDDGYTRKFLLLPLPTDQQAGIETVIMQFKGRYTACISTQVGCAMGCVFCATGQMGFTRHLSPGEIVTQVVQVIRDLSDRDQSLRNIVLMGMGEPLHNYDNVMQAIDIITDPHGLSIAPTKITLSTVGIPDGIQRMADDDSRPINLAVSLHGATDAERQLLVPPAKRYTLEKVMDACHYYVAKRGRRIFFEWALIAGKNDTPQQAHQLGKLLADIDCVVNVIPLNPTNGYHGQPSTNEAVKGFQSILWGYGIRSTVRQRRGIDVAAGCGQLAASDKNNELIAS